MIHIEDLDKNTAHDQAHLIKLWADKYPVPGEVKGGKIWLRHEVLIVSSNLSIEQAFGCDMDQQYATAAYKYKCK